jgi:hypothetical protein
MIFFSMGNFYFGTNLITALTSLNMNNFTHDCDRKSIGNKKQSEKNGILLAADDDATNVSSRVETHGCSWIREKLDKKRNNKRNE